MLELKLVTEKYRNARAHLTVEDAWALATEVERLQDRVTGLLTDAERLVNEKRSVEHRLDAMAKNVAALSFLDSIESYLERQWRWSRETFGEGYRAMQILDHIRKECAEIDQDATDRIEWIDVALLALDGYNRCAGGTSETLMRDLNEKQRKNFTRKWIKPDDPTKAVEHDRTGEKSPTLAQLLLQEYRWCCPRKPGEFVGGSIDDYPDVCNNCGHPFSAHEKKERKDNP